ncbi:MAG: hypothetical protein V2A58_03365 [Planctomycetota bacterium]
MQENDTYTIMWYLAWDCRQIAKGFPDFWNANIFWPHQGTRAANELALGTALLVWPVWASTGNPVLVYNASIFVSLFLSGLGTYLLARQLGASAITSVLAGSIYAFSLIRTRWLGTAPQIIYAQWIPFALLFLHRFFDRKGRWRDALLCSGFVLLQFISSGYAGMQVMICVMFLAAIGLLRTQEARWPALGKLTVAFAISVLVLSPFLSVYWSALHEASGVNSIVAADTDKADALSFLQFDERGVLYRSLLPNRKIALGPHSLFPGFVPILLTAAMLIAIARRTRRAGPPQELPQRHKAKPPAWTSAIALALCALGAAATVLSLLAKRGALHLPEAGADEFERSLTVSARTLLGALLAWWVLAFRGGYPYLRRFSREAHFGFAAYLGLALLAALTSMGRFVIVASRPLSWGPYALFYLAVPGFSFIRSPWRFTVPMMLALGVASACALTELFKGKRGRTQVALGLLALILLLAEAWPGAAPTTYVGSREDISRAYMWLAARKEDSPVLELPMGHSWSNPRGARYAFYSTFHWKPILNGYGRYFPPVARELESRTADFPSEGSLEAVVGSEARYVIVHMEMYPPDRQADIEECLARGNPLRIIERFGRDYVCEVAPP